VATDGAAAGPHPSPVEEPVQDRVLTIPNLLSLLRLLGVPLFLWLVLGPHADGWAFAVLAFAGVSDYLDGKIARRFGQSSRLGAVLDPAADRLYILATLVGLSLREIIPWWLVGIIVGRDLLMSLPVGYLQRRGFGVLPVHFLGKAATLCLLYAFPLLLLGDGHGAGPQTARAVGWAFAVWGTALYWWAAVIYLQQVRRLLTSTDATPAPGESVPARMTGAAE
jgi:cardiolipin synthase